MPELGQTTLSLLTVVTLGLVVVLAGALAVVMLRMRRIGRILRRVLPDGHDVLNLLARHDGELAGLREELAGVHLEVETLGERLKGAVSRVGVVRYDAFGDMGGALSFSVALLDEHGDGVVVSAINGRTETRAYGKAIAGGASDHDLSDEEAAAIEAALSGNRRPLLRPVRRRGWRAS